MSCHARCSDFGIDRDRWCPCLLSQLAGIIVRTAHKHWAVKREQAWQRDMVGVRCNGRMPSICQVATRGARRQLHGIASTASRPRHRRVALDAQHRSPLFRGLQTVFSRAANRLIRPKRRALPVSSLLHCVSTRIQQPHTSQRDGEENDLRLAQGPSWNPGMQLPYVVGLSYCMHSVTTLHTGLKTRSEAGRLFACSGCKLALYCVGHSSAKPSYLV